MSEESDRRTNRLEDYEADRVTVEVTLSDPIFPDEEGDMITDIIEMSAGVEAARLVGHNGESGGASN